MKDDPISLAYKVCLILALGMLALALYKTYQQWPAIF